MSLNFCGWARLTLLFAISIKIASAASGSGLAIENKFLYFKNSNLILVEHVRGRLTSSWGTKLSARPPSLFLNPDLALACEGSQLWFKDNDDLKFQERTLGTGISDCQILSTQNCYKTSSTDCIEPAILFTKNSNFYYLNSSDLKFWLRSESNIPTPDAKLINLKSLGNQPKFWNWAKVGALASTREGKNTVLLTENSLLELKIEAIDLNLPEEDFMLVAKGTQVLVSGPFGAQLIVRTNNVFKVTKLPVSPCDDNEQCLGSLGEDDSWFLCGSWGCYLGKEATFKRMALLPSRNPFVAHYSAQGAYLISGTDDADIGVFSNSTGFAKSTKQSDSETRSPLRKIYWTRPLADDDQSTALNLQTQKCLADAGLEPLFSLRENQKSFWILVEKKGFIQTETFFEKRQSICHLQPFVSWEEEFVFDPLKSITAKNVEPERHFADPNFAWREVLELKRLKELTLEAKTFNPILVGIVDSGIDLLHPEFRDRIASGYDFVKENETPQDEFGHGTHVAGILAGNTVGVSPNAQLIIARALDTRGSSNSIDLARALNYVAKKGAKMVNCSWGGGSHTQILRDSFTSLNEKGILAFTSAGNDGLNLDQNSVPPKDYPGVYVTGSLKTGEQNKARFSSYGAKTVALMNPGTDIGSATLSQNFGNKSGTSMSSPMTAGLAAVLMGAGAETHKIKELICSSGEPLPKIATCGKMNPIATWNSLFKETR